MSESYGGLRREEPESVAIGKEKSSVDAKLHRGEFKRASTCLLGKGGRPGPEQPGSKQKAIIEAPFARRRIIIKTLMPPRHIVTYIPLLQRGKKYKCKAMCWVSSRSAQGRDPSHKPPQKPAKSSMMYPPIGAGRCTSSRQTSLQPHCHDAAPEKSRS